MTLCLSASTPIADVFDKYMRIRGSAEEWAESTHRDYKTLKNMMITVLGNIAIGDLDNAKACRIVDDILPNYPKNFKKRKNTRNLSLIEILESDMDYQVISLTTQAGYLRKSRTFCNWCIERGYLKEQPFPKKINGAKKEKRRDSTKPLSIEEMQKLLQTKIHQQGKYTHAYQYWLPLMGMFTGARIEELCQLHVDDFVVVQGATNGTPYQCIRIKESVEDDQKLKNEVSARTIPIHPELIELGLLEYVELQKKAGKVMLFDGLKRIKGKYSKSASQWFNERFKQKAGLEANTGKTFHSYRHTISQLMQKANIAEYTINLLLGHENQTMSTQVYGGEEVEIIAQAFEKVSFFEVMGGMKRIF